MYSRKGVNYSAELIAVLKDCGLIAWAESFAEELKNLGFAASVHYEDA